MSELISAGLQEIYWIVGIMAFVGASAAGVWKVGSKIWHIADQVGNHIPSKLNEIEDKVDDNSRAIEAHEQREEVYWKLVEKFVNGDT